MANKAININDNIQVDDYSLLKIKTEETNQSVKSFSR